MSFPNASFGNILYKSVNNIDCNINSIPSSSSGLSFLKLSSILLNLFKALALLIFLPSITSLESTTFTLYLFSSSS